MAAIIIDAISNQEATIIIIVVVVDDDDNDNEDVCDWCLQLSVDECECRKKNLFFFRNDGSFYGFALFTFTNCVLYIDYIRKKTIQLIILTIQYDKYTL